MRTAEDLYSLRGRGALNHDACGPHRTGDYECRPHKRPQNYGKEWGDFRTYCNERLCRYGLLMRCTCFGVLLRFPSCSDKPNQGRLFFQRELSKGHRARLRANKKRREKTHNMRHNLNKDVAWKKYPLFQVDTACMRGAIGARSRSRGLKLEDVPALLNFARNLCH
jgi:hypothetical protein